MQGLFGIVPQALYGQCLLRPGFPKEWDSVHVKTPYIEYRFVRKGNKERYEITQHFRQPLCIVLRQNLGQGRYRDVTGTTATYQVIEVERADYLEDAVSPAYIPETKNTDTAEPVAGMKYRPQRIERYFNASVKDIFQQEYRSPRPPYTTLQIPLQGIGEWCHPHYRPDINDSVFRSMIHHGQFVVAGVPFRTPVTGRNIIYTSLWDNYPDSVTIPLQGRGESQRVKLATELAKKDTGKTVYILDEPTTGLHFEDIRILMDVLKRLVDRGNTVIIIEHNLDVIKLADHIIDMGPEGGRNGGTVLTTGTPEEVAKSKKGFTPKFLKAELKNSSR